MRRITQHNQRRLISPPQRGEKLANDLPRLVGPAAPRRAVSHARGIIQQNDGGEISRLPQRSRAVSRRRDRPRQRDRQQRDQRHAHRQQRPLPQPDSLPLPRLMQLQKHHRPPRRRAIAARDSRCSTSGTAAPPIPASMMMLRNIEAIQSIHLTRGLFHAQFISPSAARGAAGSR